MRLKITRSKNSASLYVIKSIYNSKTQSNTSKIVEKLGTEAELREKLNGEDPYVWAKNYINELNWHENQIGKNFTLPFGYDSIIKVSFSQAQYFDTPTNTSFEM